MKLRRTQVEYRLQKRLEELGYASLGAYLTMLQTATYPNRDREVDNWLEVLGGEAS